MVLSSKTEGKMKKSKLNLKADREKLAEAFE